MRVLFVFFFDCLAPILLVCGVVGLWEGVKQKKWDLPLRACYLPLRWGGCMSSRADSNQSFTRWLGGWMACVDMERTFIKIIIQYCMLSYTCLLRSVSISKLFVVVLCSLCFPLSPSPHVSCLPQAVSFFSLLFWFHELLAFAWLLAFVTPVPFAFV